MSEYKTNVEVDQNDEQAIRNAILTLAKELTSAGHIIYDLKHLLTKIEIAAEKELNDA